MALYPDGRAGARWTQRPRFNLRDRLAGLAHPILVLLADKSPELAKCFVLTAEMEEREVPTEGDLVTVERPTVRVDPLERLLVTSEIAEHGSDRRLKGSRL